jgi:hypothetical protein
MKKLGVSTKERAVALLGKFFDKSKISGQSKDTVDEVLLAISRKIQTRSRTAAAGQNSR